MIKERLFIMNIELGELIGEPIAIMCFHKSTSRSDAIKLYLKNPLIDVKNLSQGTKAFILTSVNEKLLIGKICKFYYVLAFNNIL